MRPEEIAAHSANVMIVNNGGVTYSRSASIRPSSRSDVHTFDVHELWCSIKVSSSAWWSVRLSHNVMDLDASLQEAMP